MPSGDVRRRVWRYILQYPGTTLTDIARGAGVAYSHAEYHAHRLERQGLVHREPDSKTYFPAQGEQAVDRRDKRILARLRRPTPLRIVLALIDGPLRARELSDAIGISPAATTYQVKGLEKAGAAQRRVDGRETIVSLTDADHILALLRAHPPKPDTGDELVSMLDALAEGN